MLVAALAVVHRPLGDYMARVFTTTQHWRVERLVYRTVGVDADTEQRWPTYLRSLLAFSLVGVLLLYALQRVQQWLPLSTGMSAVQPGSAWNTAVSFVTNTNWQGYSGESTMGHLVQMAGLAVQNFLSAAVGIAVAIAVIRGFARTKTDRLGNFWVDLTRAVTRLLLPLSVVAALVMVLGGVVQNLGSGTEASTLAGATQFLPGGPVASQEAIKELGTNGGGFFNANAAHPFEGPTAWVSLFQVFLLLLIPFALPRTFGRMVGDRRQGWAILGVMAGAGRGLDRAGDLVRGAGRRNGDAAGRRGDGGQGGALRRTAVRAVRRRHDADLDRVGRLDARQLHPPRRRGPAGEHDAR